MDITTALDTAHAVLSSVDVVGMPPTRAQRAQNLTRAAELRNMADALVIEHVADLTLDEDSATWGPVTRDGVDAEGMTLHGRIDETAQTPELIAPRLGLSVQQARSLCHDAVGLVQRAPRLVEEMRAGRLDVFRARVVHGELAEAPAHVEALVVEELAARAAAVGGWRESAGPLRRRARAVLAKVDADFVAARAAVEREFRSVFKAGETQHLDRWTMLIPVEDSRPLFAAVDELARQYVAADKADPTIPRERVRSRDQARTDALVALVLDKVTLTIHLHAAVPVTAPGEDQATGPKAGAIDLDALPEVVRLTGFGSAEPTPVPASYLREGHAAGRVVIDEPLECDPATGALLRGDITKGHLPSTRRPTDCATTSGATTADDVDPRYRIPEAIARFVRFRDRTCRFPGCHVSALGSDIDHVIPWPDGPTSPKNLLSLCRRHHRLKQSAGWSLILRPDASAEWTDPAGQVHTSDPVDLLCASGFRDVSGGTRAPVVRVTFEPPTQHALDGLDDITADAAADDRDRIRRNGPPLRRRHGRLSPMERQLYDALAV